MTDKPTIARGFFNPQTGQPWRPGEKPPPPPEKPKRRKPGDPPKKRYRKFKPWWNQNG